MAIEHSLERSKTHGASNQFETTQEAFVNQDDGVLLRPHPAQSDVEADLSLKASPNLARPPSPPLPTWQSTPGFPAGESAGVRGTPSSGTAGLQRSLKSFDFRMTIEIAACWSQSPRQKTPMKEYLFDSNAAVIASLPPL